jgi:light-regulated signal transduction histidine kinase (bacteriophytochrome)
VTQAIQLSGQNRVIEEQRKEIENFAFALAHDFKQPIRQIRTFASLISESIRDGQISELDDYINFLSGAARRLGNLVDVMSQYTLLNKPPSIEIVDLDSVVAGVRASIEMYLDDRSGQLITAPAPVIRGNETLMHQALQNLIVNGLKYNKSATPTVRITSSIAGDQCLIAVEDNGIGMDGAHLEKIFDPLARLHSHAEYEGSGLGLALARKAIAAQHGKVWCTSIVGTGSVFFVRIPLATPSVSAVEYTD